MKRILPLLSLLAMSSLALAQPDANVPVPPQPQVETKTAPDGRAVANAVAPILFAFNQDNARAVAMMGAFYNSIQTAKTGKCHFVLTQTTVKDGKTTVNSLDWDVIWQKDDKSGLVRSRSNGIYTVTENGKATIERLSSANDGLQSSRFYVNRNIWTQRPQTGQSSYDFLQLATLFPWVTTMLRIPTASNLNVEKRADETTSVTSTDSTYEAVFNPNGTLRNWKSGRKEGSVAEVRFDSLELNVPIPADSFIWQAPDGAKQVAPDDVKIDFNFGLTY